jgi:hypothetical protein
MHEGHNQTSATTAKHASLGRLSAKQVAITIANKTARIAGLHGPGRRLRGQLSRPQISCRRAGQGSEPAASRQRASFAMEAPRSPVTGLSAQWSIRFAWEKATNQNAGMRYLTELVRDESDVLAHCGFKFAALSNGRHLAIFCLLQGAERLRCLLFAGWNIQAYFSQPLAYRGVGKGPRRVRGLAAGTWQSRARDFFGCGGDVANVGKQIGRPNVAQARWRPGIVLRP